jgi:ATP-dependent Clp protease ATP-binding subunit ClpC
VFEKYSPKSRRVVFFARYEASQLGAEAIEPEHLLLAIMKEEPGLAETILTEGAAAAGEIRKTIEAAAPREPKLLSSVDLPLSPSSKKVMRIAADESEKANDQRIEPKHLLLGLWLHEDSKAYGLLRRNGVTIERVLQKSPEVLAPALSGNESESARILTQLSALVELLIKQGVFSRRDLAEELANRYILPDLHATLNSLLVLLVRKGLINEADRREITGYSDR